MSKTHYNWIWESELKIYAKYEHKTLSQFLKDNPMYIRFEEGDYGEKKMYVYKMPLEEKKPD